MMLTKIKQTPLTVSLLTLAIWIAIILIGPRFRHGNATESLDEFVSRGISIPLVIAPVFLLVVVIIFGWRREVGLKAVGSARSLLLLWFPALFVALFFGVAVMSGLSLTQTVVFILINTILVGISEELMFRGIVLYGTLSRFTIWKAIILTTVSFGSVHLLNGFSTGDFRASAVQSVTAAMGGLWFMAIRLRTKSIYPGMAIHGLWDCGLFVMTASLKAAAQPSAPSGEVSFTTQFILPILFELPLFLYGLWLLRGIGKKEKDELIS